MATARRSPLQDFERSETQRIGQGNESAFVRETYHAGTPGFGDLTRFERTRRTQVNVWVPGSVRRG